MTWLLNFLSGFLPLGVNSSGQQKSFGEWLGKILWVVGIIILFSLATNIWDKFFPPRPKMTTTIQSGGTQIIQATPPRDMMGIGCSFLRGYLRTGISAK
jgi:hypothetical protein